MKRGIIVNAIPNSIRALLLIPALVVFGTVTATSGSIPDNSFDARIEAFLYDLDMETDIGLADIYAIAGGSLANLLTLATNVGVGVERSAYGDEDTPLTDLIDDIEQRFGSEAAFVVAQGFELLIAELGPSLLADVDPIVLPPAFDIDNGRADIATVYLPTGPYILDIGTTQNVGDGEFARVVLGLVDSDGDDNDLEQLLNEIMTGHSGANLDFEFVPGIVGVELVDLSLDEVTFALEDGGATDLLTLKGEGVEAVLAGLDAVADIADSTSSLSLVEVGVDDIVLGDESHNPVYELVGHCQDTIEALEAIIDAAMSGDSRVDLLGFDDSRISLIVHNVLTGSADTVVLFGAIVESLLSVRTVSVQ